ncbi:hypothetical protein AMS68_001550 [Peltaster fructicola]|uniref:Threonylcarbamoyl-AMP synthase n=1 Tax=Peltaster fructicola TaxID=286661 RepID=A0A6H0XMT5_9PEZI|nr:hypothetical protein AMS68_001550 [Peltaster fructicola]
MKTSTIPIEATALGRFTTTKNDDYLDEWQLQLDATSTDASHLHRIAQQLRSSEVPIAFPTETVYGLGADATRSEAVKGIYTAKQRPSDNPLIVHFASLAQIRRTLVGKEASPELTTDPIPSIYHPLIQRFWPGPLTILLPNPKHSVLAPEVTAGLSTFGARIPRHLIALSLIQLADVPVAAPSANASTKPSPTAAEHVAFDLDGSISTIIDGGPCEVGVESTVVDGLTQPPLVLRPGGISLEQIRHCPGWETAAIGYRDVAETGSQPRAPGMKYRHYSPRAPVYLYTTSSSLPSFDELSKLVNPSGTLGVVRTTCWGINDDGLIAVSRDVGNCANGALRHTDGPAFTRTFGFEGMLQGVQQESHRRKLQKHTLDHPGRQVTLLDVDLGNDIADIARGIFGALRDLDQENVDAIIVEGINDTRDDLAAAVMNRLRKAAEVTI